MKIQCWTDGATKGLNGKLGTVKEVGLGVFIPYFNIKYSKKTNGISNNESEFMALIWAMEICLDKKAKNVIFFLDSKIVVNRANGRRPTKKKFKNERMDAFQDRIFQLIAGFDKTRFEWIPREQNTVADVLSKKSL